MGVAVLSPKHCINQGGFSQQPPRKSLLSGPNSKPRRNGTGFQTPKSNRSTRRNNPSNNNNNNQVPLLSLPFPSYQDPSPKVYRTKSPDIISVSEIRILKRGEILTTTTPSPQKTQQSTTTTTADSATPLKTPSNADAITAAAVPLNPSKTDVVLTPAVKSHDVFGLNPTGLLGSKPKISDIQNGFYAGSGFFISPPPSSVPVPAFARKTLSDEVAASLRRILQLE